MPNCVGVVVPFGQYECLAILNLIERRTKIKHWQASVKDGI